MPTSAHRRRIDRSLPGRSTIALRWGALIALASWPRNPVRPAACRRSAREPGTEAVLTILESNPYKTDPEDHAYQGQRNLGRGPEEVRMRATRAVRALREPDGLQLRSSFTFFELLCIHFGRCRRSAHWWVWEGFRCVQKLRDGKVIVRLQISAIRPERPSGLDYLDHGSATQSPQQGPSPCSTQGPR